MKNTSAEKLVREIFGAADIQVNGERPWDIKVQDNRFFSRLVAGGSMALGESYMEGWWTCPSMDLFFEHVLKYRVDEKARWSMKAMLRALIAMLSMSTGWFRSHTIGRRHYDTGNDLFRMMLDPSMNYSCGYWKEARDLPQAQEAKMELICQKLKLSPGLTVMDIGCGWGGLAAYMAKNYRVKVTGITVSKAQADLAEERCQGLPVEIRLQDYRKVKQTFDRIVSVGMFEHVGVGKYRTYMKTVSRCLDPKGIFLLHTIGANESQRKGDPWISRYIFPNSMVPSTRQISAAAEGLLVMEDLHNFGPYYDPTLMAWYHNFQAGWDKIQSQFDETFYRMWTYYLLACAATFRVRRNQLWQIVFSKDGCSPVYQSVR